MVKKPSSVPLRADLAEACSVDDLKALGSFRAVKQSLQDHLGPFLHVRARSWKDLLEAVRRVFGAPEASSVTHDYFVSRAAETIFALLHLYGDLQYRRLGIRVRHFGDRALAKRWRDDVARIIHPDRCAHPHAGRAMAEVNDLYQAMLESTP